MEEGGIDRFPHQTPGVITLQSQVGKIPQTSFAIHVDEERHEVVAQLSSGAPRGRGVLEVGHAVVMGEGENEALGVGEEGTPDGNAVGDADGGHAWGWGGVGWGGR